MRFIGCKENLLQLIDHVLMDNGVHHGTFADLFTGTTSVARHYKRRGFRVITGDTLYFSYVFQRAYIKVNTCPGFKGLQESGILNKTDTFGELASALDPLRPVAAVLEYLDNLPGTRGFMYHHYTPGGTASRQHQRAYFSDENGQKIDAVRELLAEWLESGLITQDEFYVLLAALLESIPFVSNIAGTYGAFLKGWDPRALKPLALRVPPLVLDGRTHEQHEVYHEDANQVVRRITCDVLYLDPPYNSRQYIANYHLLETVARWDQPEIYGRAGLRPYQSEKSLYCDASQAPAAFADLVSHARADHILLSYNSEGLIPEEAILDSLSARGRVKIYEQPYRRFRSDSDHEKRRYRGDSVVERVYYVKVVR